MSEYLHDWINPSSTALCIIDVQYDFASPDGAMSQYDVEMKSVYPAIENMKRLREAANKIDMPVIFIGLRTSPKTDSISWKQRMTRCGQEPDKAYALCRKDTLGESFYEILPSERDIIFYKPKYSAFADTNFAELLHSKGIDTLITCGLTTECCVDSTVRDAAQLDFSVFLVNDACAAYRQDYHDVSLAVLAESFSINFDTHAMIVALSKYETSDKGVHYV